MTRFEFGRNWRSFLEGLSEPQVLEAERSLAGMLRMTSLEGRSFLDAGSGSGLSSLAARRLGARVHSFDLDLDCVACTEHLKRRYCPDDPDWTISTGSVLDEEYIRSLGTFDIVYSWGVLHHTGALWRAAELMTAPVSPGGFLFVAIYNDQGPPSRIWKAIKRAYNSSPRPVRLGMLLAVGAYFEARGTGGRLLRGQNPWPPKRWRDKRRERGMSVWHDLVDWVGGYPFEVARPDEVFSFYRDRGFALDGLKTCGGRLGCNEYVFRRTGSAERSHAQSAVAQ